jgi:non-homologous end joining protein Ku
MAGAARPYWTGCLKLSLVTIAVPLYSATTEKERIHFHRIHEPSGERVRTRERIVAVRPHGKGLLVNVLRFPEEMRAAAEFFAANAQPSLLLPVCGGLADEPKAQPAEAPRRRKKAS